MAPRVRFLTVTLSLGGTVLLETDDSIKRRALALSLRYGTLYSCYPFRASRGFWGQNFEPSSLVPSHGGL